MLNMQWAKLSKAVFLLCSFYSLSVQSSIVLTTEQKTQFAAIYEAELGSIYNCPSNTPTVIGFCANTLKSPPNAPHILLPKQSAKGLVVLQHGLSDSPYFVRSIGDFLQSQGYVVILPLNPGHGKKVAQADMRDKLLRERWYKHTNDVMEFVKTFNLPVAVGGFSTGGALSVHYALNHPSEVDAVMLFSGALALPGAAETMGNIWGIKSLAKWVDGDYETYGVHPYKYPKIAGYSALVLLDVIRDIRSIMALANDENKPITMPIFAAHSLADNVTPFNGIEALVASIKGEHVLFKIDEDFDVCHADLPMSQIQLISLKFDKTKVNQSERCAVPKANPLHQQMMSMLSLFLVDNMRAQD